MSLVFNKATKERISNEALHATFEGPGFLGKTSVWTMLTAHVNAEWLRDTPVHTSDCSAAHMLRLWCRAAGGAIVQL